MQQLQTPHSKLHTSEFFGRRKGRPLRKRKENLLQEMLPEKLIVLEKIASLLENKRVWLEIGFGNGEHLAELAAKNPEVLFIGCEPFINGIAGLLALIEKNNLNNIYIFNEDARLLLRALPDNSIEKCFILFADPWPKARHAKRRFICKSTLELLHRVMLDKGVLQTASDHPVLIEWIKEQFSLSPFFEEVYSGYTEPKDWCETKYQRKALAAGRACFYMNHLNLHHHNYCGDKNAESCKNCQTSVQKKPTD
ncbi:MAG: tRNA (guanosine(46)-N7)-methyltransferase TrmB [Alphaproteobacteria bacterium]|nr:tRNA (guanosine(46)-N7)-methyltransferase TrmB [Alphaproteobacteria bacterium]